MLLFYCSDCKKIITGGDSESTEQILDRLDEHLSKCSLATFTCEGTSGIARRRLGGLRSECPAGKIRLLSPVSKSFENIASLLGIRTKNRPASAPLFPLRQLPTFHPF